jgi:hypothetical protein
LLLDYLDSDDDSNDDDSYWYADDSYGYTGSPLDDEWDWGPYSVYDDDYDWDWGYEGDW